MDYWDLTKLPPSTDKAREREPGADAPRVATRGVSMPRVLFSHREARGIVVDFAAGDVMGDHQVRERAIVNVARGTVDIECGDETVTLTAPAVVVFEPGERHAVTAQTEAQLLLVIAIWRADTERDHLPRNAVAPPTG